ncbi:uncharacterized protein C11orf24 homolog isoform X2 [Heptranchias perlo]|uniref:uncharacterized protein C11orf24 homolog isoform X2 n=1 Tax=Heptranchias perlo TaxID=212740 RepID=UPI00355A041A
MTPSCSSFGRKGILFGLSSKMWTPLCLVLYISVSSLTESSMYNLQNNGIKVLKSIHVSGAEECNQTCDHVSDQGATVEDIKALQIGQSSPIKIFLNNVQRNRIKRNVTVVSLEIGNATMATLSPPVANINMAITTMSPAGTNTTVTTTTVAPTVTTAITTVNVTLASPHTSGDRSLEAATTIATTPAPNTNSSAINGTKLTSKILTSSTEYSTQRPTSSSAKMSSTHESNTPMSTSQQTTPATTQPPTTSLVQMSTTHESSMPVSTGQQTTPASTTVYQTKMTSAVLTESTTFPQAVPNTTKQMSSLQTTAPSSTPKLTSKAQRLTVTPTNVSTTQPIQEETTLQEQGNRTNVSSSTPGAMPTSTMAGGTSQPPEIKPRTTVAFSDEKNYVFPSVHAEALIKYLANTSSLIAVLIFGLLFFSVSILLFAQKAFESYKRKDYVQVDYLINGMYADSDM